MTTDDSKIGERTISSALSTLFLAQAVILDELIAISPAAAKRISEQLNGYVTHIEKQHGKDSVDAATTRVTVSMLLQTINEKG